VAFSYSLTVKYSNLEFTKWFPIHTSLHWGPFETKLYDLFKANWEVKTLIDDYNNTVSLYGKGRFDSKTDLYFRSQSLDRRTLAAANNDKKYAYTNYPYNLRIHIDISQYEPALLTPSDIRLFTIEDTVLGEISRFFGEIL